MLNPIHLPSPLPFIFHLESHSSSILNPIHLPSSLPFTLHRRPICLPPPRPHSILTLRSGRRSPPPCVPKPWSPLCPFAARPRDPRADPQHALAAMSLPKVNRRESDLRLPTGASFYIEEEGEGGDLYGDEDSSGSDEEATPIVKKPLPQPTSGFQQLIQPINSMFYGAIAEEEDEGEDAIVVPIRSMSKDKQGLPSMSMGLNMAVNIRQDSTPQNASLVDGRQKGAHSFGGGLAKHPLSSTDSLSHKQTLPVPLSSLANISNGAKSDVMSSKSDLTKEKTSMALVQGDPNAKKKKRKKKSYIGVNLTLCKYESVRRCIADMGWKEVGDDEDWVIFWTDSSVSVERVMSLKKYQKINHFPGTIEISRKANMARNLRRMYKQYPEDYNIFPKTWILPQELPDFRKVLKRNRNRTYILKPDAGAQGKGIYLVRKPEDIIVPETGQFPSMVAQQYLSKPLLIDGYKFDMRLYALIMGCDPLKIYLYKEGMGRFCTETYEAPTEENMENTYMHLTNYSINKFNDKFAAGANEENFGEGSKRTLSAMKSILIERGIDWDDLWSKISDIIIKTMISVQPLLSHLYHTCVADDFEGSACFEILGFDIIIDHKLRPILLEVNHSPSLTCDTPLDNYIKDNLLRSVCQLLKIDPEYKKKYRKEERARTQQRIFGNKKKPDEGDPVVLDKKESAEAKEKEWEERLKWEDENIGNFTRIYPTSDSAKYDPFFAAALNGLVGETQASIGKKLSTLKKLEEQEKAPLNKGAKAMTSKGSERRIGDKNLFDKGLGDRSGQEKLLPELGTNSDRKGRSGAEGPDGIPLDLSQPKDPSFDDDTDSRKRGVNTESSRSRGQSSSRTSITLPAINDTPPPGESQSPNDKKDILGLTELQAQELCLPVPDDRYRNPDFQKRLRMMRAAGIREKVTQMVTNIQEAQKLAKQQTLAQKVIKKEEVGHEARTVDQFIKASRPKEDAHILEEHGGSLHADVRVNSEKAGRVSVYVPMHLRKQLLVSNPPAGNRALVTNAVLTQSRQRIMDASRGTYQTPGAATESTNRAPQLMQGAQPQATEGYSLYNRASGARSYPNLSSGEYAKDNDLIQGKKMPMYGNVSPGVKSQGRAKESRRTLEDNSTNQTKAIGNFRVWP